jgi:hypothetical protein
MNKSTSARHLLTPLLTVLALLALLSACGSGEPAEASRPLNDAEAARLAQSGFANLQAGGAAFEATSAFLVQPIEQLTLVGQVDWVAHTGRALVRGTGPDAGLAEVYWDLTSVYERRPAMDIVVGTRGGPATPWVVRPADPTGRQLDRLIALVMALASEQADNALLIQQTAGSAFLRTDDLRATPVEVLRYGTRNLYWLALDDGRLLRFEGNAGAGTAPTVIDLMAFGPVSVNAPPVDALVPVDQVAPWYAELVG